MRQCASLITGGGSTAIRWEVYGAKLEVWLLDGRRTERRWSLEHNAHPKAWGGIALIIKNQAYFMIKVYGFRR